MYVRPRIVYKVVNTRQDYVDACERLAQLNLTEVQQREVVRVLVNCCGNVSIICPMIRRLFLIPTSRLQEKVYNPYYTFVCQHLCRTSHSYKITLQFCLWDFLRDLGEASVGGAEVLKNLKDNGEGFEAREISSAKMRNVANAYAWWVAKDCIALSIFKASHCRLLKLSSNRAMNPSPWTSQPSSLEPAIFSRISSTSFSQAARYRPRSWEPICRPRAVRALLKRSLSKQRGSRHWPWVSYIF